jgi:ribokinase
VTVAEVAVVGSLNLDVVVPVERHPGPGETVLGGDHAQLPGGKGANQAVAAARLGRRVAIVGRVGADDPGRRLRAALGEEGVDQAFLRDDPAAPTGLAMISVSAGGENAIVVSPGANGRVAAEDVAAAAELLASAAVTLVQLEIPEAAVAAAATAAGGRLVLNPAPARALDGELLRRVDVLVPNRGELALLAGARLPPTARDAAALTERLDLPGAIVVTLGAGGALVRERGRTVRIDAAAVDAVDATGAGDAFCGALADALARGAELVEAARWAVRAASLSVTRPGALAGMPTRRELGG